MGNIIKGYKIDIPKVTGNIAITVRASYKSGSTTPVNGDVMGYLTHGKGINQTTAVITDNPECWASVNLVPVTQGKTYTISCDATYAWVYSFDAMVIMYLHLLRETIKNLKTLHLLQILHI